MGKIKKILSRLFWCAIIILACLSIGFDVVDSIARYKWNSIGIIVFGGVMVIGMSYIAFKLRQNHYKSVGYIFKDEKTISLKLSSIKSVAYREDYIIIALKDGEDE